MKAIASKQQIPEDNMHKRMTIVARRRVRRLRMKHGTANAMGRDDWSHDGLQLHHGERSRVSGPMMRFNIGPLTTARRSPPVIHNYTSISSAATLSALSMISR